MKLSVAQIEQFRNEGYIALEKFWEKTEIAAMRAELKRLESDGFLHNVATAGDGKTASQTQANLQICPMWPHSTLFRAMPFAPKVIEAVAQLLGDDFLLQLDQAFLKPAHHGSGTNWHQDNAYFKISNPLQGTALWTAIHDANAANGTMRIVPGSFREELEHTRDPDSNHHIRCYPDETKARLIELPAGGVLFFAYGTAHATGANTTDHERAGVALHFLSTQERKNTGIDSDGNKHPVLSGPNASGGEREYGLRIAGTWEAEVEKSLREKS